MLDLDEMKSSGIRADFHHLYLSTPARVASSSSSSAPWPLSRHLPPTCPRSARRVQTSSCNTSTAAFLRSSVTGVASSPSGHVTDPSLQRSTSKPQTWAEGRLPSPRGQGGEPPRAHRIGSPLGGLSADLPGFCVPRVTRTIATWAGGSFHEGVVALSQAPAGT